MSDYSDDGNVAIIIDNGSGFTKCGVSTEEAPSHVFPTVVGIRRPGFERELDKEMYCGDELDQVGRNKQTCVHPIERGVIEHPDYLAYIWEYIFDDLLTVKSEEHPVVLTEAPFTPKSTREETVQTLFETFDVPELNISMQGPLALVGHGCVTGIALDAGEGLTHCTPVFDNFALPHAIHMMPLGGYDVTVLLAKLVAKHHNVCCATTDDLASLRECKEKHCYVSLAPGEGDKARKQIWSLPDGREVKLGEERWKCTEALFTPQLVGEETAGGVAGLVWDTVKACEIDIRKQLIGSIVLSGGSTMFPGFTDRLRDELKLYAPTGMHSDIKVMTARGDYENRTDAVWRGGQVMANLRDLQPETWMTKTDYEECGAALIHEKLAVKMHT